MLVFHPDCQSCRRFVDAMTKAAKGTPALRDVRAVNVMTMNASERAGIDTVPTMIMDDGRRLAGTAAFEWLDTHRAAPDPFSGFGGAGLGFAGIGGADTGDGFPFAPL